MLDAMTIVLGSARWARFLIPLVSFSAITLAPEVAAAQTGTISGTVTAAATGTPLSGGQVWYCTTSTGCVAGVSTNASGNYTLTVPPGTYYLLTDGFQTQGYSNEIFDNIRCPGQCDFAFQSANPGAPVVVSSGGAVPGQNFALDAGGSIGGQVTDAASGAPVSSASVTIRTRVGNTTALAGTATTSAAGGYSVMGLPTGVYYASVAGGSAGYTSEIFDNILCPGNCSASVTVNSGTGIPVTAGNTTGPVNFGLNIVGRITGTVVNAQTAAPLQGVAVRAYTRIGLNVTLIASGITNAAGAYTIALPTGTYHLLTSTNLAINEIYNNVQCIGACATADVVVLGEPIPVALGGTAASKDFQLEPGGAVSGTVTDAVNAAALSNATVQVYGEVGGAAVLVSSATTNASGVYTAGGIPTGTYFALVSPANAAYVAEILGGAHCPQFTCGSPEILAGSPIAVAAGASTMGQNVFLDLAGAISGTVTNAATAVPIPNTTVFAFTGGASPRFVGSTSTNAAGVYAIAGLPAGTYFLGTSNGLYVNEAYDNVPCPAPATFCTTGFVTTSGTPVPVTGGATTASISFALAPQATAPGAPSGLTAASTAAGLQFSWSPPTSGGAPTAYVLEAGVSPGTTAVALPSATSSLLVPGAPAGVFFLRVKAVNGFGTGPASAEIVLTLGSGGTVAPNPPSNLFVWTSGGRLTMTWAAPSSGTVPTGYVVEAGTASGLANIASINVTGRSFVFDPVPNGFFFLRVRSRSAAGLGAPTSEVMINVGGVPAPPSAPRSLSSSVSGSTLTLSWQAPVLGTPTSYVLEAGTASGLSNITTLDLGSAATTFVVAGVPPGTYYVRLRARSAQGVSPVSNERVVTVL